MNKTYRLVWNAAKSCWIAAAEYARSGARGGACAFALALAAWLQVHAGSAVAAPPAAAALPTGGQVVAGQAAITQNGASMTVNQGTARAAIDWASFNVGSQAQVSFVQPSSSAVALNRVTGHDASQIFGRISANGQVFLSNPNGVYFAPGASVDVGGLVATTHRIGLDDFLAGKTRFERNGASGSVVNEGELKAALGGYIALLAPEVRNQGLVLANLGTVALAAGEAFELQFDGNHTLASLRVEPGTLRALVDNRSAVLAPGGLIILSAQALNAVQGGVVRNSGTLEASGLSQRGGRIVLEATEDIDLAAGSTLNANGATGGGTVLVGGDWQGSGNLVQATTVTMADGARIDASATQQGDGGTVVLWSDVTRAGAVTRVDGRITATGAGSGQGGRVETSGHAAYIGDGAAIATGNGGQWLLDPANVIIGGSGATISAAALATALNGNGTVTQYADGTGTDGNITVNENVVKTGAGTGTLQLLAKRNIMFSGAGISSSNGALNLVLVADYDSAGGGSIFLDGRAGKAITIDTKGGHVWLGGNGYATGGSNTTPWNGLNVGQGWANSDDGTAIYEGVNITDTKINTAGGDVYIAGRTSRLIETDARMAVRIQSTGGDTSAINTGGGSGSDNGSITIQGMLQAKDDSNKKPLLYGVELDRTTLQTSNGSISITGSETAANAVSSNTGGYGVQLRNTVVKTTGASASATISITGSTGQAGSGSDIRAGVYLLADGANAATTVQTAGGSITINGTSNTTNAGASGVLFATQQSSNTDSNNPTIKVVSNSGAVAIIGDVTSSNTTNAYYNGGQSSEAGSAGVRFDGTNYGKFFIGDAGSGSFTGSTTISGRSVSAERIASGYLKLLGTGAVTIQPIGDSFYLSSATQGMDLDGAWDFGTQHASLTFGRDSGSATKSDKIRNKSPRVAAGPINVYARDIVINANLTSQASNGGLLLKASGDVVVADNVVLTTNNSNLTLWADADGNNSGFIGINSGVIFNSANGATSQNTGGGAITLAGGNTSANGLPTGYAFGSSGSAWGDTPASGVQLGAYKGTRGGATANDIQFYSGGGNVLLQGRSSNGTPGVSWFSGKPAGATQLIDAGSGTITIKGEGVGTGHGIELTYYGGDGVTSPTLRSSSNASTAITLNGSTNANGNSGYQGTVTLIATGSGGISVNGTATTGKAINAGGISAYALSGPINFTGIAGASGTGLAIGGTWGKGTLAGSSSNITLTADAISLANSTVDTTGALTIQPKSASFSSALTYPGTLTVNSTLGGLTLGKDGNTSAITIASATSVNGPIALYGGGITLNAGLTSTLDQAAVLVKATGSITTANALGFTTKNGSLTFWSDADNEGDGKIAIGDSNSFNSAGGSTNQSSGGGNITLGGGAAPTTGYAQSANGAGLQLGSTDSTTTTMHSGGGNILLRGKTTSATGTVHGLHTQGLQINAGQGAVEINGVANAGYGIEIGGVNSPASKIVSSKASGSAITLSGRSISDRGVVLDFNATKELLATGSGSIDITGSSGNASSTGVWLQSSRLLASSGAINIDGGSAGVKFKRSGVLGSVSGDAAVPVSSSNITITGDKFDVSENDGLAVRSTGTLTIQPSGTSFTNALNFPLTNVTLSATLGGLTLGKEGNTNDITVSSAQTVAGPIRIYGGTLTLNAGLSSTASGAEILLKGMGNIVQGAGVDVSTNGGAVTYWADADNNSSGGINLVAGSSNDRTSISTGGGALTMGGGTNPLTGAAWAADIGGINLAGYVTLDAGSGAVSLRGANSQTDNNNRLGVRVINNTQISGGNVTLVGQASANGGSNAGNFGVAVEANSSITASGTLSITGSGGGSNSSGGSNHGVYVSDSTLSASGDTAITGTGGGRSGGGTDNDGVNIANGSSIRSGAGALLITGTAGHNASSEGIGLASGTHTLGAASGQSGNITLRADSIGNSGSVHLLTSGGVTLEPLSSSFSGAFSSTGYVFGSDVSALTLGKPGNTADITLTQAATVAGPVALYGGNLVIDAALAATGDTVTLVGSGMVTDGAAGSISAAHLLLGGGNVLLDSGSNQVGTLAASGVSGLTYANSGALTLGTVNGTQGVSASGAVVIVTTSGDLTVAQNVATTSSSANALALNAGASSAALAAGGGNLLITNGATISVGSGGTAALYSGSISGSTGLTDLVGSGSGRFRYGSDESTQNFTLALGAGLNAIYREQPSVALSLSDTQITYGDAVGGLAFSLGGGVNGDTAAQAFAVLPGVSIGGAVSSSGHATAGTHAISANGGGSGSSQLGYAGTAATAGAATLDVAPRTLNASYAGIGKTYDGNTSASATSSDDRIGGDVFGLSFGAVYADANAGAGKVVSVSGAAISGADAANYVLASTVGSTTATITPKVLSVNGLLAADKTYDGGRAATITDWGSVSTGVGSETLALSATAAQFDDANAGTGKTVTATGYTLADGSHGGLASNYTLASTSATTSATVHKAVVTVTAHDDAKFVTLADNPAYAGYSYSGFVNGEGSGVLSGNASVVRSNAGVESAGVYAGVLQPDVSLLTATNYSFATVPGTYTVVPSNQLLVRVSNVSSAYGSTVNHSLTEAAYFDGVTVHPLSLVGAAQGQNRFEVIDGANGSAAFTIVPLGAQTSTAGHTVVGAYTLGATGVSTTNAVNFSNSLVVVGHQDVTPLQVTANASSGISKTYDGSASMAGLQIVIGGVFAQDLVSISGSGSFAGANAGTGLGYSVTGVGLSGSDAGNYRLVGGNSFSGSNGTITPKTLTVSADKVYDGTTALAGAVTLGGLVGNQTLNYVGATASDAHVATAGKHVSNLVLTDGDQGGLASNYRLPTLDATHAPVNISPRAVQGTVGIGGVVTKVYDGTTVASGATLDAPVLTGVLPGDVLGLAGLVLAYNSAHAGVATQIGASGAPALVVSSSGSHSQASDYSLGALEVTPAAASITPALLSLQVGASGSSKVYDGSTAAGAAFDAGLSVSGLITGDSARLGYSAAYDSKNVATASKITLTGISVTGIHGSAGSLPGDYVLDRSSAEVAGHITPRSVSVGTDSAPTKVYDGTTAINVINALQLGTSGLVAGDQVSVAGSGSFATKDAGTGLAYTVSGLALSGADAANYQLAATSVSGSNGVITPRPLNVGYGGIDKVYDGHTTATVTFSDDRLAGDVLNVGGSAAFADKNVGSGKVVTVSGLTLGGADAHNYVLAASGGSTQASITQLASVTWVGGSSGNWFDPANWAGGAVPDLSNVKAVVLPAGVVATFDPAAVVAPAQAGAVTIESLGSSGGLVQNGGELNVGGGGVTLTSLTQNGGSLASEGSVQLGSFTQTGGSTSTQGNLTVNGGYTQGSSGSVSVQGQATLNGGPSEVTLGNLTTGGALNVQTTGGSGITQAPGTQISVGGNTVLAAGNGSVTLNSEGNSFAGVVLGGNGRPLGGGGAPQQPSVNEQLAQSSQLPAPVPAVMPSTEGAPLLEGGATGGGGAGAAVGEAGNGSGSAGGAGSGAGTGAGTGAGISAGASAVPITGTGDGGSAGGTANPVTGADAGGTSGSAGSSTSSGTSGGTGTADSTGSSDSSTGAADGPSAVTVRLESLPEGQEPGRVAVYVPSEALGAGFVAALPDDLVQRLPAGAALTLTLSDGSPLPGWLRYDAKGQRLIATAVPPGALPLTVVVRQGDKRLVIIELTAAAVTPAGAAAASPASPTPPR